MFSFGGEKLIVTFEGKEIGFIFLKLEEIAKLKREISVLKCERCNRIKHLFADENK